ncbi:unnamed protein product [Caenorhabditis bovis]|uniref:AMP-dependent synthetase/ligase domain-containing protein n=1 Tax=Caenorhabditis bovis TaxID=2654633 RepID=A0A8S1FAW3_9PELO|nr:unnamed protein product [Caenorhabditis bovis]
MSYPNVLFHKLILQSCEEFAEHTALVQDEQVIKFGDIPKLVSRMISKLLTLEIASGDVVLVCFPNSPWYPILFLACAQIGAIMSGISPTSTNDEFSYYLKNCCAKVVFISEGSEKKDDWTSEDIIIETLPEKLNEFDWGELRVHLDDPQSIDSVILAPFSSGTTGLPKCCLLTHRNFLASTYALKKALFDDLLQSSTKKTLAFLPFYHASGFWALLYCLLEGCTTYIMSDFHPMIMMDIIEKYKIDTINIVPSIANILIKIGNFYGRCPSLRTILCGASHLSKERCKKLLSMFPQITNFLQGYGMTELVVLSHITPFNDNFEHLGSCGKLLPGFEAKLLYSTNSFDSGELLLKSDAIMKQYKHGLKNVDDDGWLHTGDIVKIDKGFYYVVDRKKDLIKVNGFQVSPTEIENAILMSERVADVAVVGIEDELCGQLPKAYIVLEEGTDELLFYKHIEHLLREKLSSIKQLRGGISIVNELPKSASGKVQKHKLVYY